MLTPSGPDQSPTTHSAMSRLKTASELDCEFPVIWRHAQKHEPRKHGAAMLRLISYAGFCLKKIKPRADFALAFSFPNFDLLFQLTQTAVFFKSPLESLFVPRWSQHSVVVVLKTHDLNGNGMLGFPYLFLQEQTISSHAQHRVRAKLALAVVAVIVLLCIIVVIAR